MCVNHPPRRLQAKQRPYPMMRCAAFDRIRSFYWSCGAIYGIIAARPRTQSVFVALPIDPRSWRGHASGYAGSMGERTAGTKCSSPISSSTGTTCPSMSRTSASECASSIGWSATVTAVSPRLRNSHRNRTRSSDPAPTRSSKRSSRFAVKSTRPPGSCEAPGRLSRGRATLRMKWIVRRRAASRAPAAAMSSPRCAGLTLRAQAGS
jgi:hypothetical protein